MWVQSKLFNEIAIGDTASLTETLTKRDILLFAAITGDMNPAHIDEAYAKDDRFHGIVGHGMWVGSLFSTLLGTELPGPGTIYLNQTLSFKNPVRVGDSVTASVTVTHKDDIRKHVTLACRCVNQHAEDVVLGEALVLSPDTPYRHEVLK